MAREIDETAAEERNEWLDILADELRDSGLCELRGIGTALKLEDYIVDEATLKLIRRTVETVRSIFVRQGPTCGRAELIELRRGLADGPEMSDFEKWTVKTESLVQLCDRVNAMLPLRLE